MVAEVVVVEAEGHLSQEEEAEVERNLKILSGHPKRNADE